MSYLFLTSKPDYGRRITRFSKLLYSTIHPTISMKYFISNSVTSIELERCFIVNIYSEFVLNNRNQTINWLSHIHFPTKKVNIFNRSVDNNLPKQLIQKAYKIYFSMPWYTETVRFQSVSFNLNASYFSCGQRNQKHIDCPTR